MIKLAVIMAAYHGDDPLQLDAALASIVAQELPRSVVSRVYLGIDGKVSSDIEKVIEKYRTNLYTIHRKQRCEGLALILNELIALTRDEKYVFRMDADDRSHSQRFMRQLNYLEANDDVDILGTAIVENDVERKSRRIVRFAPNSIAARRDIAKRPPLAHPTACFRRTVFDTVGGYPIVPYSEDVALWFKCLEANLTFHNLPEPLYEFTIGKNFWSRRSIKKAWREYKTWSRGLHRLEGFTWRQIYPLARLIMRIGPNKIQQVLYERYLRGQVTLSEAL